MSKESFETEHGVVGGRGKEVIAKFHAKKKELANKMKKSHSYKKEILKKGEKAYEKDEPEMGGKLK